MSVLLYSVSLNNEMKQWAFTSLDLVLWRRYSPVKLAHYFITVLGLLKDELISVLHL